MPLGAVWSPEEDEYLRQLVTEHGPKKWSLIASHLNTKGSKQCRRRWKNFLNVDLKKGGWTSEEDRVLIEAHRRYGNKWTEIAKLVGGRTDNAVKNRWAALCKRNQKPGKQERTSGLKMEDETSEDDSPPRVSTPRKRKLEMAFENGDYPEHPRTKIIREESARLEQPQAQSQSWKSASAPSHSHAMKPPVKKPGLVISIPNAAGNEPQPQPPLNRSSGLEIRVFKEWLTPAEVQFARELNCMGIPLNIVTEEEPPLSTSRRATQTAISALASPGSASGGTNGFEEVLKWFQTGLTPKTVPSDLNVITGRIWHPSEAATHVGSRLQRSFPMEQPQHRLAPGEFNPHRLMHSSSASRESLHRLGSHEMNGQLQTSEGVVHQVQQNSTTAGNGFPPLYRRMSREADDLMAGFGGPLNGMPDHGPAGMSRRYSESIPEHSGMTRRVSGGDMGLPAGSGMTRRVSGGDTALPSGSGMTRRVSGGDMPMPSVTGMTRRVSGGDPMQVDMVLRQPPHAAGSSFASSETMQRHGSVQTVVQQVQVVPPAAQPPQQQVYHVQANGSHRHLLPQQQMATSPLSDIHDGHRKLINKLLYTAMNSPSSAGPSAHMPGPHTNSRLGHLGLDVKGEDDLKGRMAPWGSYQHMLAGQGTGLVDSPVMLSPHFSNTELSLLLETLTGDDLADVLTNS